MGRISGGKHAGLPFVGQIAGNLDHIGIKADGEHAIGFVKNQHLDFCKMQGSPEQMIKDAPGGADNHLTAVFQGVKLLFVAHAAIKGASRNASAFQYGLRFPFNLEGKLSCWHQHKCLGKGFLRVNGFQHGQKVGSGLAAARARLNHDVTSGQQIGNGKSLHGHQFFPAAAFQRLAERHGQFGGPCRRQGIVWMPYCQIIPLRLRLARLRQILFFIVRTFFRHGHVNPHYISLRKYRKQKIIFTEFTVFCKTSILTSMVRLAIWNKGRFMTTAIFDALDYFEKLKAAGVPEERRESRQMP